MNEQKVVYIDTGVNPKKIRINGVTYEELEEAFELACERLDMVCNPLTFTQLYGMEDIKTKKEYSWKEYLLDEAKKEFKNE